MKNEIKRSTTSKAGNSTKSEIKNNNNHSEKVVDKVPAGIPARYTSPEPENHTPFPNHNVDISELSKRQILERMQYILDNLYETYAWSEIDNLMDRGITRLVELKEQYLDLKALL